ncbi:hypothetical protein M0R45_019709 [Rubus argutus]|uniref:Uncharacterized protein n=1 Tax=Rubus argutus TaxID=59490 RepID=A0AAW1X8L6_RUBAR
MSTPLLQCSPTVILALNLCPDNSSPCSNLSLIKLQSSLIGSNHLMLLKGSSCKLSQSQLLCNTSYHHRNQAPAAMEASLPQSPKLQFHYPSFTMVVTYY